MAFRGLYTQLFPPKPTLTEDNVPSQRGKVFVVTGGNSGVGYELCKILYGTGATIYMASRSQVGCCRELHLLQCLEAHIHIRNALPLPSIRSSRPNHHLPRQELSSSYNSISTTWNQSSQQPRALHLGNLNSTFFGTMQELEATGLSLSPRLLRAWSPWLECIALRLCCSLSCLSPSCEQLLQYRRPNREL